jgi:hypothetical protein
MLIAVHLRASSTSAAHSRRSKGRSVSLNLKKSYADPIFKRIFAPPELLAHFK